MLVDSWYDSLSGRHRSRAHHGWHAEKRASACKFMLSNDSTLHNVDRVGVFRPEMTEMVDELGPGEIGFLTASIKQVRDTRVGDTITQ